MNKQMSVVGNAIKKSYVSYMIIELVHSNTKSTSSKSENNRLGTKELRETEGFYFLSLEWNREVCNLSSQNQNHVGESEKRQIPREANEQCKRVKRGKTRMTKPRLLKR